MSNAEQEGANKDEEHFIFVATAIPGTYVSPGSNAGSHLNGRNLINEIVEEELPRLDMRGMPLKFSHSEKDMFFGTVSEQYIADNNSVIVVVDMPPVKNLDTVEGRAFADVRRKIIDSIEHGTSKHVSVSMAHRKTIEDGPVTAFKRELTEISLVDDPRREGADIFSTMWSKTPFSTDTETKRRRIMSTVGVRIDVTPDLTGFSTVIVDASPYDKKEKELEKKEKEKAEKEKEMEKAEKEKEMEKEMEKEIEMQKRKNNNNVHHISDAAQNKESNITMSTAQKDDAAAAKTAEADARSLAAALAAAKKEANEAKARSEKLEQELLKAKQEKEKADEAAAQAAKSVEVFRKYADVGQKRALEVIEEEDKRLDSDLAAVSEFSKHWKRTKMDETEESVKEGDGEKQESPEEKVREELSAEAMQTLQKFKQQHIEFLKQRHEAELAGKQLEAKTCSTEELLKTVQDFNFPLVEASKRGLALAKENARLQQELLVLKGLKLAENMAKNGAADPGGTGANNNNNTSPLSINSKPTSATSTAAANTLNFVPLSTTSVMQDRIRRLTGGGAGLA